VRVRGEQVAALQAQIVQQQQVAADAASQLEMQVSMHFKAQRLAPSPDTLPVCSPFQYH